MEYRTKALCTLLACLQAVRLQHQNGHWVAKGCSSYSDHEMLQRLYEDMDEEIDVLGERIIGLCDHDPMVDHMLDKACKFVRKWSTRLECPIERSLMAEKFLLQVLESLANHIDRHGQMTMGLSDLLEEIASLHEEHCYLLKQRLKPCH